MRDASRLAVSAREADTGPDLEAEADALLLVGVDAVTAPGRDVLEAEEVVHDVERCSAVLAEVETWVAVRQRMEVAAARALLHRGRRQPVLLRSLGREEDAVDEVARALVVDDAARPELRDREEPRALEELISPLACAAGGDKCRERKPWEAVAGEEALAREVAVAVEVGLPCALLLSAAEELDLGLGLVAQTARHVPGGG